MWTWNSDPFGTDAANANPAGMGVFPYNLRFPGQVFNGQAGLHQNYFRDFDPATGRYAQSDPLGVKAGVNTYAYVGGNPITNRDPLGLMCISGVGCFTTPAEARAAQSGDYLQYYQLACAGGDATACFDAHIAANDNFWGHRATNRLLDKLRKKAQAAHQCLNEEGILNQIRIDLAKDYANSLPNSLDQARWPSAQGIAQYHWSEFAQFGLPPDTFGGTPFGQNGPLILPGTWCPNCTL